ncbi:hypothetical protein FGO68_gene4686 [Halteria grandinella]|uniref:Uncharacterized protein n=1 Tax=Halteria grandinella TaxID=5974 RepID=A0A8J8SUX2_HALGN|nr:hypothetical protein FGO68_gene4686 [Halteria grandinella]
MEKKDFNFYLGFLTPFFEPTNTTDIIQRSMRRKKQGKYIPIHSFLIPMLHFDNNMLFIQNIHLKRRFSPPYFLRIV